MINLVTQSFGRENEYKRCVLVILSFYAFSSAHISQTRVILFTDNPDYFTDYLHGLPVTFVRLTPEKIKTMRGKIDFLHRMKIALIDESFSITEGIILYADSDTFFTHDPIPITVKVDEHTSFMHEWEYFFKDMPTGPTFEYFKSLLKDKSFLLTDGTSLNVSLQDSSWNAGVMFFHPTHRTIIPDVYELTNQFYPGTHNHASEQYAFSIMLQKNSRLSACSSVIYHYWHRIKKQIVDLFLEKKLTQTWGRNKMQEKLKDVRSWTAFLPQEFPRNVLTSRDNAIQALNEDRLPEALKWTVKAIAKNPFYLPFIKDVGYYIKRRLIK